MTGRSIRICLAYLALITCTLGAHHATAVSGTRHVKALHADMPKPVHRKLKLIANSISCTENANKTVGSFCGSVSVANYTVADAAAFFQAQKFATILGKSPAYGVRDYVIKYKTQIRKNGSPIDATGTVFFPVVGTTKAPAGGFPIAVFCHYSVGISDLFAPSQTLAESSDIVISYIASSLRNYVANGFIIVVPDYAGLGVPNIPHYYLVKKPTAYSVIDSARSVKTFAIQQGLPVSSRTLFVGSSQGGSAVLQAQEIYEGEGYGKSDFQLKGVVSIAPAPVWRYVLHDVYESYNQELGADAGLYFWAASKYNSNLNLTDILSPASILVLDNYTETISSEALVTGSYFPSNLTDYLSSSSSVQDGLRSNANGYYCYTNSTKCKNGLSPYNLSVMTLTGLNADWQTQLDEDSPGLALFSSVPVLFVQGSNDTTISPYYTIMLAQKLMNNGVPVVDQAGKAITWNGPTDVAKEFKITSNCTTTNGQIVTCGLSHSVASLAVELYAPFIFSKADMMGATTSAGVMEVTSGSRWITWSLITVAAFLCYQPL